MKSPVHLRPLTVLFDKAVHTTVRALISVARQHGKTTTVEHALVQQLLQNPGKTHAIVSYESSIATNSSRRVMQIAKRAGLKIYGSPSSKARPGMPSSSHWFATDGAKDSLGLEIWSEVYATGIGGPLNGKAINGMLIVDDPHKGRDSAESSVLRNKVVDWYRAVASGGAHPSTSMIVVHSRWHPNDLIGELSHERNADGTPTYQFINLPAIGPNADPYLADGEPLWPEERPKAWLDFQRDVLMGPYDWASLMLGQPRIRGAQVFRDVFHYDSATFRPDRSFRIAIGIDLAYTDKTSADYSVAVVLMEWEGQIYVVDVKRAQASVDTFAATLRELQTSYPTATMLWHRSGTEKGTSDLLRKFLDRPIVGVTAHTDKFNRAQPVSVAWNQGKILVPSSASWVSSFVQEITSFTGVGDKHDDQVDALASAYTQLERSMWRAGMQAQTIPTKFEPYPLITSDGKAPQEQHLHKIRMNPGIGSKFQW